MFIHSQHKVTQSTLTTPLFQLKLNLNLGHDAFVTTSNINFNFQCSVTLFHFCADRIRREKKLVEQI